VGKSLSQIPFTLRCIQYGNKYFRRPATHVWCKQFAHSREVLLMRKNPWSLCCFDDRCNDRSGRFPHAVKPACDGINVYTNLDDTLKNETLMFDVFKKNTFACWTCSLFSFNSQCCSTLASCKQKTAGQNTARTDCVLSTSDVTVMMSSS